MRRLAPLLFALALIASRAEGAMQGENLLVPPMPAGWIKAYGAEGNGINMVEYVPAGQSLDSWTEMINVEVFFGRGGTSPALLQQKVTEGFQSNCDSLHVDGLGHGTTSGLSALRWISYCTRVKETGKGEITYAQAISGKANFYLVQRVLRVAPFALAKPPFDRATLAAWQKLFDQVAICDSSDAARPCP
jgi:hypothetical protein